MLPTGLVALEPFKKPLKSGWPSAVRGAGEESFEMVVPAMKVNNFHFSEVTKF